MAASGNISSAIQSKAVGEAIEDVVRQNYLRLAVFYDTKAATIIQESPKYEFNNIMSSLGGALGCYLGISLISLFEFAELVLRFAMKAVRYGFGDRSGGLPRK